MQQPLRSLLCPIQLDVAGAALLRYAAEVAAENDATLHVLHVYDEPKASDVSELERIKGEAEAALSSAVEDAQVSHGVQEIVRCGKPVETIAALADELQVDMVLMSPHHRTFFKTLVERSVTDAVSHATTVPVLVVPSPV